MDKTRKRKRQYCGHCDDALSHSAYYEHKRTYFRNGVWLKDPVQVESTMRVNSDGTETVHGDIEDEADLNLFLSVSDSESSDNDSHCDQEEMLDNTGIEDAEVDNEKHDPSTDIRWESPSVSPASQRVMSGIFAALERLDESVKSLHQRFDDLESAHGCRAKRCRLDSTERQKRGRNRSVSEAVRRLHNAQEDATKRYDADSSVSSPHNSKVTTFLVQEVSLAHPHVEPETVVACCKTYFETLRRSSKGHNDSPEEKGRRKVVAALRQRKRRLYRARGGVVHANEDVVWKTATVDLMSDEEDAILDGKPVWVVRPPSRSRGLSALCTVLQKRLELDRKYVAGHHRRVSCDVFSTAQ